MHGSPAPVPGPISAPPAVSVSVDPALTRPFPMASTRSAAIQPSAAAPDMHTAESADMRDHAALSEAKERGIVIHRMLDRLTASAEPRASARERLWREFGYRVADEKLESHWQEACALVDDAQHRALFDPGQYLEARNEVPILYRWNNVDVAGVIDRLLIRDGDLLLIDYKTDRVAPGDIEALSAAYAPQLKLYAEGLRRLWPGKNVEALLLFTASRRRVPVNLKSG
jgi:ATP-dependent helicase/nuclease subunit A